VIVLWVIWICDLGCHYPAGGEVELYDEEGAFGRACAWTSDQDDPHVYRAVLSPAQWTTFDLGDLFTSCDERAARRPMSRDA
jgi:hypothetical protein